MADAARRSLTERVRELLEDGRYREAARVHKEGVRTAFEAAARGEVIDLSDLMASAEALHLAAHRRAAERAADRLDEEAKALMRGRDGSRGR